MKIVYNACYGGFSLSPKALALFASKKGKECYFFRGLNNDVPVSLDEIGRHEFFMAYSVPNPDFKRMRTRDEDGLFKSANEYANTISLCCRDIDRNDQDLVAVVEELGEAASGSCAKLKIADIPDGAEYEIEEYDGLEQVVPPRQTWS
ncbi:MAG: hypothetical protein ACQKBW_04385 [Puniceicoccales bacterium]